MRRLAAAVGALVIVLGVTAPEVAHAGTEQQEAKRQGAKKKKAGKAAASPKKSESGRSTLESLGDQLKTGAQVAKESVAPAWEQMERGAGRTLAAARSMDEAMNGCTLQARKKYEYSSLGEYYLGRALAAEHIARLEA